MIHRTSMSYVPRYMSRAFDMTITDIVLELHDEVPEPFDTVIGVGLSGALVIPTIGRDLDVYWGVVRKRDDISTHSGHTFEGTIGQRWLFVDDKVATGNTRRYVHRAINRLCQRIKTAREYDFTTEYVGTYQYMKSVFTGPEYSIGYDEDYNERIDY